MTTRHGKEPLIVSIGGGKGGVGKSMVSSNLAVQYAQAGLKVILLDLDFGAANVHTIFGIRSPSKGLGDYFTTPRSDLHDYLVSTKVKNLQLIPGSGFVPELANLRQVQKLKLIRQIKTLDADMVLLDLGAGSSNNVVDFFSLSHGSVIVTTPEPTAVVNTYEFLKNVIYRVLTRMFKNQPTILSIIKGSVSPKNQWKISTIEELVGVITEKNRWVGEQVRAVCEGLNFYVVFNQARKSSQAQLGVKLREISQKHLCVDLNYAGMIYYNEEVPSSVIKMCPISIHSRDSVTTKTLRRIAHEIGSQLFSRLTTGERTASFEEQFARVAHNAESDFKENRLTQRRIDREIGRWEEEPTEAAEVSTL